MVKDNQSTWKASAAEKIKRPVTSQYKKKTFRDELEKNATELQPEQQHLKLLRYEAKNPQSLPNRSIGQYVPVITYVMDKNKTKILNRMKTGSLK